MLRIGILGAARVAVYAMLEPARTTPGCAVVAVAARDHDRAREYAAEHGIGRVHTSYADLIADPAINLVYVATPPHNHSELAAAAIAAGKAVLVEKPFAMDADEAESVFRLAAEAGVPVFEAMHSPHHPLFARVASLIGEGAIGEMRRIEARFDAPISQAADEFRWRPELGGGALMDLGVYPLAWVRRLAGEDFEVEEASADLDGVDTAFHARLRFAGGAEAAISSSLFGKRHRATLRIEGSLGRIEIDNFVGPHRGHRLVIARGADTHSETVEGPTTYEAQLQAVRNTLADGAPFPFPDDDFVRSMRAIDTVRSGWAHD